MDVFSMCTYKTMCRDAIVEQSIPINLDPQWSKQYDIYRNAYFVSIFSFRLTTTPPYNGGVFIPLTAKERKAWKESIRYPKQPGSDV